MVGRSKRLRLPCSCLLDHCPHSVLYAHSFLPAANRHADKLTQPKMSGSPTIFLFPPPFHTTARGTCITRTVSSRTGNSISRLVGPITCFCKHSGGSKMTLFQIKNTHLYISRTSLIIDLSTSECSTVCLESHLLSLMASHSRP